MSTDVARAARAELEKLGVEIRTHHDKAQAAFSAAVEEAILCGKALQDAKAKVQHGQWLPWLEANFPAGVRTAQNYMRLAEHAEDAQRIAHLGIGGALKQLAAPKPADDPYRLLDQLQAMLPDLDGQDWEAFKQSIADLGVLVPVVKDQDGRIIDGRQRVRAANELGVKYRVDVVKIDPVGAAGMCFSLNVARAHERGPLTGDQARQAVERAAREASERGDRLDAARLYIDIAESYGGPTPWDEGEQ